MTPARVGFVENPPCLMLAALLLPVVFQAVEPTKIAVQLFGHGVLGYRGASVAAASGDRVPEFSARTAAAPAAIFGPSRA